MRQKIMTKPRSFGAPNLRQSFFFLTQLLVVMVETFRMSDKSIFDFSSILQTPQFFKSSFN